MDLCGSLGICRLPRSLATMGTAATSVEQSVLVRSACVPRSILVHRIRLSCQVLP
jgi:hypothetical protein